MNTTDDIRQELADTYETFKPRAGTAELRFAHFVADEPAIFGAPNEDYIKAEIEWYNSQDRAVEKLYKIYGKRVEIWDKISDDMGLVNSQYGHLVYTKGQYVLAYHELMDNPESRQAVMYYAQGPDTHKLAREGRMNGIRDHICTTSVQYFLNCGMLTCLVNMRSNDAIFGYPNDRAWQQHILEKLAADLTLYNRPVKPGPIIWSVGSLHVYERHYNLIDDWIDGMNNARR